MFEKKEKKTLKLVYLREELRSNSGSWALQEAIEIGLLCNRVQNHDFLDKKDRDKTGKNTRSLVVLFFFLGGGVQLGVDEQYKKSREKK